MIILKFWGTSLKDMSMIQKSASIIVEKRKKNKTIVVVSAMSWVTNILIDLCDLAVEWNIKKVSKIIGNLSKKHKEIAGSLCANKCNIDFLEELDKYTWELFDILRGVSILKHISSQSRAKILYFGEILSTFLLSVAVERLWKKSRICFSKDILSCHWDFINWECDYELSQQKLKTFRKKVNFDKEIPIITWFWGGDEEGNIYLFDRWGSDYVATLIWTLLKVKKVEIRTDVDGVYSADPKIVDNPILWKELDYSVAAEFALVWAKVLHPKTISPAQKSKIMIVIKNTFAPEKEGTTICKLKWSGVKWINIDYKQTIFTFIDPSMISTYGYIADVLKVFKKNDISVDAIATTETSFSISIKKKFYNKDLIKQFDHLKEHFNLKVIENVSKISIVWDSIDNYKILNKLKNIIMVSSWAHQKSLTIFVKSFQSKKIIKTLHKDIFNS